MGLKRCRELFGALSVSFQCFSCLCRAGGEALLLLWERLRGAWFPVKQHRFVLLRCVWPLDTSKSHVSDAGAPVSPLCFLTSSSNLQPTGPSQAVPSPCAGNKM